jgi:drug/metabolite transporter (DMT)-like permease
MTRGILLVFLAACSWGTYSLFLRPTGQPATTTAPVLFLVMGLVTLPFALRSKLPPPTWKRTTIWLLVANTLLDALNVITFFAAIANTTVAIAVLTHYVAPILIALAAPRIEGIAASGTRPAALVALTGLVIVLEPWQGGGGVGLGAVLGLVSACCYASNTFVVKRLAERIGATRAMAYHSLAAGVLLAPLLLLDHPPFDARTIGLVAAAAVTLGALSGVVFVHGLTLIGSARAAVLTYAEPLVAVAVGAIVWHEPMSPLAGLGGLLVLGSGLYVVRASATRSR